MSNLAETAPRHSPSVVPEFVTTSMPWARFLLVPLSHVHRLGAMALSRLGRLGAWLRHEQLFFFLISAAGLILLVPKYFVLARFVFDRFLLGQDVIKPDTSALPWVPNIIVPFLALFFVTFFLPARYRFAVLLTLALPIGYLFDGVVDPLSVALFLPFLGAVYLVAKLPVRRSLAASIVCLMSLGFALLCNRWPLVAETRLAAVTLFQAAFTPMLWYSVYEQLPPKKHLRPPRFLLYHFCRFFGSPVVSYGDLYSKPTHTLARIRFDGFKALYVAVIAATASWASIRWTASVDPQQLSGPVLLWYSYVFYVGRYCKIVVGFNVFIGIARLFGVPVRDNFNYWLLARTPNEHWRRWNLLLREWVITFVFFPIMRAKRWLFVAIMASLLCSGLLHLLPSLIRQSADSFVIASVLSYWTINGLAIYLVVKIPNLFPSMVKKLRMDSSIAWSAVGVVLTSAFYAILFGSTGTSESWAEVGGYFGRLLGRG